MNFQTMNPDMHLVERAPRPPLYALPLILLLLASTVAHAATQVGSAPYRASATGAGNSHAPVFSADGRHIAFVSHANNLVTNDDLAPHLDLFVRDLVTSNTVLVSVSTNGFGGGNDNVGLYSMSSNAQVVAFDTAASNLLPWDNNRVSDIYVRDLQSGSITRVSWGLEGDANGPSYNPLISEDGQRVIFESLASNLVTNDFNGTNDIFLYDVETRVITLVSVNAAGTASPDGPSHSPSISADGLTVAFVSHATNLVAGVTNLFGEVYLRDIGNGSNLLAMASQHFATRGRRAPDIGVYRPSQPVLSSDGRFVLFRTLSSVVRFDFQRPLNHFDLQFPGPLHSSLSNTFSFYDNPRLSRTAGDGPFVFTPDGRFGVYLTPTNSYAPLGLNRIDYETLVTNSYLVPPFQAGNHVDPNDYYFATNVSCAADIVVTNDVSSSRSVWTMTRLEANDAASRLFFIADSSSLVSTVTNRSSRLYQVNFPNGLVQLIDTNSLGNRGPDLGNVAPSISRDGSLIAWDSPDDALVPDDLNRAWDVFLRNVDTGETQIISAPHSELPPATGTALTMIAGKQSLSANGSRIVVLTGDNNLVTNDTNHITQAVMRDLLRRTNVEVSGAFPVNASNEWWYAIDHTTPANFSAINHGGRYAIFSGRQGANALNTLSVFWRDLDSNTNDWVYVDTAGQPSLSADGRQVAYARRSTSSTSIYLRNLRALPPTVQSISNRRDSSDFPANRESINPVFSPDSRWVIFQSLASDLTYDPDLISGYQLYAREIDSTFLKRISYSSSLQTNVYPLAGGATNPVFSADARFVFFDGATNSTIYRHDLINDMDDAGTERRPNLVVCAGCANPSASSEGRYVAYESRPTTGGTTNVFLKDIESGQVELISVSLTGTNGNGSSFTPLLSHDARFVVFASKASDLVPGDHNRAMDIFVRDRWAGATHALSRNLAGTGTGNRVSSNPILSADGRTVAFQSFASDLVAGDYNDTRDVFVVTLGGPDHDSDTMEDDWEMAYFNTRDRDGSGDFDQDGASDLAEFRAGTNPANDTSILRVLRLTTGVTAGSEVSRTTVILWSAIPGRTYRVESKAHLDATWSSVGADVVASTVSASAVHAADGGEAGQFHRFYRVVLVRQ